MEMLQYNSTISSLRTRYVDNTIQHLNQLLLQQLLNFLILYMS